MTPTSEDLLAAVRVHADRVHDAVRRLGCSPAAALEVVQESAFDLVDLAARPGAERTDLVGWWFARARALGRRAADSAPDLPLGGGVLAADEEQVLLAEVLEELPERDRFVLLLKDSYALPEQSVATALGSTAPAAWEVLARARLMFLLALEDEPLPALAGHPRDLPALARLAQGPPVAARDATSRRHVQSCPDCTSVVALLERAHLLLAGLTVAALPDLERVALLSAVADRARATLPGGVTAAGSPGGGGPATPRRLLSPLFALLLLGVAVLAGLGLGIALSRGGNGPTPLAAGATAGVALLPPTLALTVSEAPPAPLAPAPTPSVFVIVARPSAAPVPSASPTSQPSANPAASLAPLSLALDQSAGPNNTVLTVRGAGWPAGQPVRLDYLDQVGRPTGSRTVVTAAADGTFSTTLAASDPTGVPGRHSVRAVSGGASATSSFDAS